MDHPARRTEEHGEVKDRPDQQETAEVSLLADVLIGVKLQFAEDPGRKQQQGQRLLGLVKQKDPAGKGGDGPEENRRGPVFFDIEDLTDEGDGGTCGDGSDGVQHGRESAVAIAGDGAGKMEHGDQGEDKGKAAAATQLIPVRRDKENHTGAEKDPPKDEGDDALPADSGNTDGLRGSDFARTLQPSFLFRFPGANAVGGFGFKDTRRQPAV